MAGTHRARGPGRQSRRLARHRPRWPPTSTPSSARRVWRSPCCARAPASAGRRRRRSNGRRPRCAPVTPSPPNNCAQSAQARLSARVLTLVPIALLATPRDHRRQGARRGRHTGRRRRRRCSAPCSTSAVRCGCAGSSDGRDERDRPCWPAVQQRRRCSSWRARRRPFVSRPVARDLPSVAIRRRS